MSDQPSDLCSGKHRFLRARSNSFVVERSYGLGIFFAI
jgi:hypothetical protein